MKCPSCGATHYKTKFGVCCTRACYNSHIARLQQEWLDDIAPDARVHKDGALLVIGVKPTREQQLKDL